jgi:hypothetical protein
MMSLPPTPAALAYCGTEPPFYDTIGGRRTPSLNHTSWELCLQSYARNHPAPRVDRDLPLVLPPATPPSQPGVDDSLQMWLAQHVELTVVIGVLTVLVVALVAIALVRRSNRREESAA